MSTPTSSEGPERGATLVLFPTELERRRVRDQGGLENDSAVEHIVGFGVAAAGARCAQLIAELQPRRVLLVGIAGAYDGEQNPVGEALVFSSVAIHGIGVGSGSTFRGPTRLGFPQWPGSSRSNRRR